MHISNRTCMVIFNCIYDDLFSPKNVFALVLLMQQEISISLSVGFSVVLNIYPYIREVSNLFPTKTRLHNGLVSGRYFDLLAYGITSQ